MNRRGSERKPSFETFVYAMASWPDANVFFNKTMNVRKKNISDKYLSNATKDDPKIFRFFSNLNIKSEINNNLRKQQQE